MAILKYTGYLRIFAVNHRYPKTAKQAAEELQKRGANATEQKLRKLAMDDGVKLLDAPHRQPKWSHEAIEEAAELFDNAKDYTDEAIACRFLGLTMDDYWSAVKVAYDQTVAEFGDLALFYIGSEPNPSHYEMYLSPARPPLPARVSFTLAEDIRAALQMATKSRS